LAEFILAHLGFGRKDFGRKEFCNFLFRKSGLW
jgi:hypothetical protein